MTTQGRLELSYLVRPLAAKLWRYLRKVVRAHWLLVAILATMIANVVTGQLVLPLWFLLIGVYFSLYRLSMRRFLKKQGWPQEVVDTNLDLISNYFPKVTWRRLPPYDAIGIIPWRIGTPPPGLYADIPFAWSDPRAELWATLRLLQVQRNKRYATCDDKYWDL